MSQDTSWWSERQLLSWGSLPESRNAKRNLENNTNLEMTSMDFIYLPGMILSGPFLEVISVNSLRILAAFFASDFKLEGIGLFTKRLKKKILMNKI